MTGKRKIVAVCPALVVTMMLFLSAGGKELEMKIAPDGELERTEWELVSIDGQVPLPGTDISLGFSRDGFGGSAGCNSYSGEYKTGRGESLEIRDLMWTSMACSQPEGILEQESEYLAMFDRVDGYIQTGNTLVLTISSVRGNPTLEYRFVPPKPDADFEGTWRVVTFLMEELAGSVVSGTAPGLVLEEGSLRGDSGCGWVEGRYRRTEKGEFEISGLSADAGSCADEAVREQHERLMTILEEAEEYSISGNRLTIITGSGDGVELEKQ